MSSASPNVRFGPADRTSTLSPTIVIRNAVPQGSTKAFDLVKTGTWLVFLPKSALAISAEEPVGNSPKVPLYAAIEPFKCTIFS